MEEDYEDYEDALDDATLTALQAANVKDGDTVSLKIQYSSDGTNFEDLATYSVMTGLSSG